MLRKVFESQPFLILATVLSGVLSIVVIGLVADNLAWYHSKSAHATSLIGFNYTINDTEGFDTATVSHLPIDTRTGSYWLMLAAGIGGFIDAVLLGGILCWRRLKSAALQSEHGQTYDRNLSPQTELAIFVSLFSICRSLAATIYAFQEWAASGTFTPQEYLPLNSANQYTRDFFTIDAWLCQYEDYVLDDNEQNMLNHLCSQGTAARTVTLAIAVTNAFGLYGVLYRAYKRRQAAKQSVPFRGFDGANTLRSNMSEARTEVAEQPESKMTEK